MFQFHELSHFSASWYAFCAKIVFHFHTDGAVLRTWCVGRCFARQYEACFYYIIYKCYTIISYFIAMLQAPRTSRAYRSGSFILVVVNLSYHIKT